MTSSEHWHVYPCPLPLLFSYTNHPSSLLPAPTSVLPPPLPEEVAWLPFFQELQSGSHKERPGCTALWKTQLFQSLSQTWQLLQKLQFSECFCTWAHCGPSGSALERKQGGGGTPCWFHCWWKRGVTTAAVAGKDAEGCKARQLELSLKESQFAHSLNLWMVCLRGWNAQVWLPNKSSSKRQL